MEIRFPPALQEQIDRAAADNSTAADEYVQQLVERYLEHDAWFRREVKKGIEQLDRGVYLTHEEVVTRIEKRFAE